MSTSGSPACRHAIASSSWFFGASIRPTWRTKSFTPYLRTNASGSGLRNATGSMPSGATANGTFRTRRARVIACSSSRLFIRRKSTIPRAARWAAS